MLADLDRLVMPGLSDWQHPRFFGYFPSNALPAGILGDIASTGLGVLGLIRHQSDGFSGEALEDHTRAWAEAVNRSGEAYLTPATLDGRWMVRISVGALHAEAADVAAAWASIRRHAERLSTRRLGGNGNHYLIPIV
jgi:hypothetical protein